MNESIASQPVVDPQLRVGLSEARRAVDKAARRVLDLSLAAVGMLLLAPLFVLIAVLIKRDSPGPIFYWGERVGRHGRPFHILKFRTMYETGASYNGPRVTGQGDPRITPFGHWLRDTKVNELPQLLSLIHI